MSTYSLNQPPANQTNDSSFPGSTAAVSATPTVLANIAAKAPNGWQGLTRGAGGSTFAIWQGGGGHNVGHGIAASSSLVNIDAIALTVSTLDAIAPVAGDQVIVPTGPDGLWRLATVGRVN